MPAEVADIAAAIRPARVESWSDAAVKTRYPNARDGQAAPAEGFFDSAANAVTVITARAALFGTERRRFIPSVQDLLWPDLLTGIPVIALVDAEQQANGNHIPARIELSLEDETTSYEVFG
jgi:hypothetical protein